MEKNRTAIVLMISGLILIGISLYYGSAPSQNDQIAKNPAQNSSSNIQIVTHSPTTAPFSNPFFQQSTAPQQNTIITARTTPIPVFQPTQVPAINPTTVPFTNQIILATPTPITQNSNTSNQENELISINTEEYNFYYPSTYARTTFSDGIQYASQQDQSNITLSKKNIAEIEEELTNDICKTFVQDSTIIDVAVVEADFLECHIAAKNGSSLKMYRILNTYEDESMLLYYVSISYPENSSASTISILQQALAKFELF
jgi:hypothetical protein